MGEILAAIFQAFFELLLEVAIIIPGYWLAKWFRPKSDAKPDGCLALTCGIVLWLLVGIGVWGVIVLL